MSRQRRISLLFLTVVKVLMKVCRAYTREEDRTEWTHFKLLTSLIAVERQMEPRAG